VSGSSGENVGDRRLTLPCPTSESGHERRSPPPLPISALRSRSSRPKSHMPFRRPAWPRRTRSAPPASRAPAPGSPALRSAPPAGRHSSGGSATPAPSAAGHDVGGTGDTNYPVPRVQTFRRRPHNVRLGIALRTPLGRKGHSLPTDYCPRNKLLAISSAIDVCLSLPDSGDPRG
jgi:hypothetical protein